MGRDLKAQLGARVPRDVREAAVADAKKKGMSLNAYMEHLIVQAHGSRPIVAPLAGQITVDEAIAEHAGAIPLVGTENSPTILVRRGDQLVGTIHHVGDTEIQRAAKLKSFARNCTNGTLHWKHGPGNPCPSCGGEV